MKATTPIPTTPIPTTLPQASILTTTPALGIVLVLVATLITGCDTSTKPMSSLETAVQHGDEALVLDHITYGTPLDQRDRNGWTALNHAVRYGNDGIVELLVDYGANVNNTDVTGRTILHYAHIEGHRRIIETLRANGATTYPTKVAKRKTSAKSKTGWAATGTLIQKEDAVDFN